MNRHQEPPPSLRELLRFYADAGVDAALEEVAADRFGEVPPPVISPLGGGEVRSTAGREKANDLAFSATNARSHSGGQALPGAGASHGSRPSFGPPTRGEISQSQPAAVPDEAQAARARELAREAKTLKDLHEILARFDGCNLKFTAKNLVFADGNPQAPIMFVGEAPGREEDLEGRPFVGRSGQLLDRMLGAIGLDRDSAYIANVIPWRPPGNRAPTPLETEICRPFIERQIELVNPKLVVMLGGSSAKVLLKTAEGIMRLRGTWRSHVAANGVEFPAMPTLHPAYLLRNPAHKRLAWRDFLEVKVKLKQMSPLSPGED